MTQQFAPFAMAVMLAVTAPGCQDGPAQYEVVGAVSYQGQALSEGMIIFAPRDGIGPVLCPRG